MLDVDQITIFGTGLLGASVGLGLKAAGFGGAVVGVGRRRETLDHARALGAIDRGVLDFGEVAADTGLALIAVPLSGFDAVFATLARHDHPRLYVTDLGSTKASVVAAAGVLPDPRRFCGAHPMAGSEAQGPGAAMGDLFRGKPCVLTPGPDTDPRAVALSESLWTTLGMTLLRRSPEDHDRAVAAISHLPHVLAVLLMNAADDCGGLELGSTGLRDTSRLASSNPPMRRDILLNNRAAVVETLGVFARHLDIFRAMLAAGPDAIADAAVLDTLEAAAAIRAAWLNALTLRRRWNRPTPPRTPAHDLSTWTHRRRQHGRGHRPRRPRTRGAARGLAVRRRPQPRAARLV